MGLGTADGVFATFTALGLLLLVCMHAGLTESIPVYKRLCVGSNLYKMMTEAGENPAKAPKSKHMYRFIEEPLYKRPGL